MARNSAPESPQSGWETIKVWLGIGTTGGQEPWSVLIASLLGAVIVAAVGWLIFDFEFAVIVFVVGALNGAYQEWRGRRE